MAKSTYMISIISLVIIITKMIYNYYKKRIKFDNKYIDSYEHSELARNFIISINKEIITEICDIKYNGYSAHIEYKFYRIINHNRSNFRINQDLKLKFNIYENKPKYYKVKKFNVKIYKNGQKITQHNADHYESIYLSHGHEYIDSITNFVKYALNDIYEVCMNHNNAV
jgi:hypothetical protein